MSPKPFSSLSRRSVLAGFVGGAVVNALGGRTAWAQDLSDVTLSVGTIGKYVPAVWLASGAFDDVPYKIKWVNNMPEIAPILAAFASDSLDLSTIGGLPIANAIAAEADFKIISTAVGPASKALAILVPKDSPIHSAQDLRGKTVVTTRASAVELLTYNYLKNAGIPWSDIKVRYLDPDKALLAFTQGDIEAWASYPPGTSRAIANGSARVLVTAADKEAFLETQRDNVANPRSLQDEKKVAAIRDYVVRQYKANEWVKANLPAAQEAAAKALDVPLNEAAGNVGLAIFNPIPFDKTAIANLQGTLDALHASGIVTDPKDVAPYFDDRFKDVLQPFVKPSAG